jgi:hypothetical protein
MKERIKWNKNERSDIQGKKIKKSKWVEGLSQKLSEIKLKIIFRYAHRFDSHGNHT